MKGLRRFFKYLRPYRKNMVGFVILTLLATGFGVFSLTLVIPFLQIIFDKAVLPDQAPGFNWTIQSILDNLYYAVGQSVETTSKSKLLFFLCIGVVGMFLLKNLSMYFSMHVIAPMRAGVMHDIRKKMFYRLTNMPLGYYTDQRKGDIMTRMSADVVEIEWSIMNSVIAMIKNPIMIIATVTMLLIFSPKLTLFVLVLLPISAIIINRLGRSLKKSTFKGQKFLSDLMVIIEETLGGIKIIKSFTAERYVRDKFDDRNRNFVRMGKKVFRKRSLSSPLSEFLGSIVIAIVIWFGGNLVIGEQMQAEVFITYIAMFSQIISPAKAFSNAFYSVQAGTAMLDRVEEIIQAEDTIEEKSNAVVKNGFEKAIELKNVSFRYEQKFVLQDINLEIPKGQTMALVGQSGAGKSTLVDLISRFYDVEKGSIQIDGTNVTDMTLSSLRDLIGIVPQQSILFNETISNNIAFGDENPDEDKIMQAAKMANAHEFIMEMDKGYQSYPGEQGDKLSGGQKQRIAIARALYKNAPILLLDEATSSLDNESEKLVQDALNNLMQDRTSVIIAHRLSTIQHADVIVVLDEGKVVETGSHNELLGQNGVYRKLYELSFSESKENVN